MKLIRFRVDSKEKEGHQLGSSTRIDVFVFRSNIYKDFFRIIFM
ncbi:hypothetical protein ACYE2N_04360 [Flavobacterium sp. MAHUQ-51]